MRNPLSRLLSWWRFRRDFYRCRSCGYVFPKKGAEVSGYEGHAYGFHVHCPRCGHVVAQYIKNYEF